MLLQPGQVVAGYRLEARLGHGAMGTVFRARHVESRAPVAIKALDALAVDPELRARFEREGLAMARVGAHPHVLRVHALLEAGGQPLLVLELAEGGDLMRRVRERDPSPDELRAWFRGLTAGAAHLHAAGIVHRDIKPQNVLFDGEGRPKLGDFGLARLADARSLTVSGHMLGTPAYMPPEQIEQARTVGPPADIYGLGALLFWCLTRRPPYQGDSLPSTLGAILHQPVPDPRELAPDAPADLAALCMRMLAKRPGDRPDAGAVLAALEGDASPATATRRSRGWGLALGAAVLALGVALSTRGAPAPARAPTRPTGPASAVASRRPASPRNRATPAESLDARLTRQPPVERTLVDGYRVRCLDDTWALVITHTRRLFKVPLAGGEPIALLWQPPREAGSLTDLAVDRASGRFAVTTSHGWAWIWREGLGGEPSRLDQELASGAMVAFSADGSRLAARSRDSILVLDGLGEELVWSQPFPATDRMWFGFLGSAELFTASVTDQNRDATSRLVHWAVGQGPVREWSVDGIVCSLAVDPVHGRVAVGTGLGTIAMLDEGVLNTHAPPLSGPSVPLDGAGLSGGAPIRDLIFVGQHLLTSASSPRYMGAVIVGVKFEPRWALWDLRQGCELEALESLERARFGIDPIPDTHFVIEVTGTHVSWRAWDCPASAR